MKKIRTRIDFFKDRPGMVIAELGVFIGDFSRKLIKCQPAFLLLVDIFEGEMSCGIEDGRKIVNVKDMSRMYEELKGEFTGEKVLLIQSSSVDFLLDLHDNSLDCVYIDTTHQFELTRDELSLSRDKVKSGGWITGHDYNIDGVRIAVDSFCQLNGLQINYLSEDIYSSYFIKNLK